MKALVGVLNFAELSTDVSHVRRMVVKEDSLKHT